MKNKLKLEKIKNDIRFNELDIEKRDLFLDSLQNFVVEAGLEEIEGDPYTYDGKDYGGYTFYTLFGALVDEEGYWEKRKLENFMDGEIVRYHNNKIELLIIFLQTKIKMIFYCDLKERKKILKFISKFVDI